MLATEETLGQRIRRLREERGMQLKDLAEATGLRVETLSRIETGHYAANPTARTLRDIARVLEVDVTTLKGEG